MAKRKNKILTDDELISKKIRIQQSLTPIEKLQDDLLLPVQRFLIAVRDGQKPAITIGQAIAYNNRIYDEMSKLAPKQHIPRP